MSYPSHIKSALDRLKLVSLEGLTAGYVEELVGQSEEVKRQPLVEHEFWDAFHLLREITNKALNEKLEAAREKERAQSRLVRRTPESRPQSQDYQPSIPQERREVRRYLGNLIYSIRQLKFQQPKLINAYKEYDKRSQELQIQLDIENASFLKSAAISDKILELEKQIASIHNDKSTGQSASEKSIKQNSLREEIRRLKESRRVNQPTVNKRLSESQKLFFESEIEIKKLEDEINSLNSELQAYKETIQLFSVVQCEVNGSEREIFLGPFVDARNTQGFEYWATTSNFGSSLIGKKVGEQFQSEGSSVSIKEIRLPDPSWLEDLMHPAHWEGEFILRLPDARRQIELWGQSPGFSNNSRHTKGG